MRKRGRPSSAALEIQAPIEIIPRQPAPHDLTDEETEVWVAIVNVMPADWLSPATAPIMTQYCRHAIHARRVAELIEAKTGDPDLPIEEYDRLLKMQERESRAIASLATKMRLTQQATTNHRGNKTPTATTGAPWTWRPSGSKRRVD